MRDTVSEISEVIAGPFFFAKDPTVFTCLLPALRVSWSGHQILVCLIPRRWSRRGFYLIDQRSDRHVLADGRSAALLAQQRAGGEILLQIAVDLVNFIKLQMLVSLHAVGEPRAAPATGGRAAAPACLARARRRARHHPWLATEATAYSPPNLQGSAALVRWTDTLPTWANLE